ncbi:MAG: twin-arginine translocase subunit TatC [Chloroflexi bacterium]|nr:twin-arginine translocase subunit TatC [Chloroflexota bacterium]
MRKFLHLVWRIVTFPFRAASWLLALPLRGLKRFRRFLTAEPGDRPLTDAFADTLKSPGSLLEHIQALRKHLFRMLVATALAIGLASVFTAQVIDFLSSPIGGIATLKAIDVTESVSVFMRVALLGGIAIASPYLAFELWLFAAPGLRPRSRILGMVGIPLATLLLLCGMAFAFYIMLPVAMPFLLDFMGIETIPRPSSYINFVSGVMFWIGVAFEFPLVVFVLALMGLVEPRFLMQQWRIAVVVIAIISAAITPTVDPVNMALVMGPMALLYFLGIGLGYLASLGRRGRSDEA